jgi:hypothetical protein
MPLTKIILLGDRHYPALMNGCRADAFMLNARLSAECRPQLARLFPPSNASD